jgi:hypothetical protein
MPKAVTKKVEKEDKAPIKAEKKVVKKVEKEETPEDKESSKVLKSDELGMGGFLSGLGFSKKVEQKPTKEEVERQEEEEASVVLDKPRHASFSFDTVVPNTDNVVRGYRPEPRAERPSRPAAPSRPASKPANRPAPRPGHLTSSHGHNNYNNRPGA